MSINIFWHKNQILKSQNNLSKWLTPSPNRQILGHKNPVKQYNVRFKVNNRYFKSLN